MMAGIQTGVWLGSNRLILASGSQTRADLLTSAGFVTKCVKPKIDERVLEGNLIGRSPAFLAEDLAEAKAQDVAGRHGGHVVLGADQVLEVDGVLLHKPVDLIEAKIQLSRLQGRTHVLHSGVAIVSDDRVQTFHDTARLSMRALSTDAIDAYIALAGEKRVISSVGGYQLEGLGIHLFEHVDGDHSTVLGLPLLPLLIQFRAMGLLAIS